MWYTYESQKVQKRDRNVALVHGHTLILNLRDCLESSNTWSLSRTNRAGSKLNFTIVITILCAILCLSHHCASRHFLQRSGLVQWWTLFSWWKVQQPQSTNFSNVTYWSKITYAANLGRFFIPASLNSFHQLVWRLLPIERRANLLRRSGGSFRLPMTWLAIIKKPGEDHRLL